MSAEPSASGASDPAPSPSASDGVPAAFSAVPRWTRDQALAIEPSADQVAPVIDPAQVPVVIEGYHLWDWWPVRDRDGQVARIDGWFVMIGLTAPDDVVPGKRHDIAEHRYAISRDGTSWQDGGPVFVEGDPLGSRQWAGSAMYDAELGRLTTFYTAAGDAAGDSGGGPISYEQRMAMAQATVEATDQGVTFTDWTEHEIVLEGRDDLYASTTGTTGGAGKIDAFRDPWYFRDPADGAEYLLFTATLPSADCWADGVVGVARATADDLASWELQMPILMAPCVNKELERPHFVVRDGRYYLFFTTHSHTFDPTLTGAQAGTSASELRGPSEPQPGADTDRFPEGLYGFVADAVRGEYQPLNGSGLVLANPSSDPYQAYSWLVLPNGWVGSFAQYVDLGGRSIQELGDASDQFQIEHFVGQPAPAVELELAGDSTKIVESSIDYGPALGGS